MSGAVTVRRELQIAVPDAGDVSALFESPDQPRWTYVFGHGAGAGMRHAFMQAVAERFASHDVATFRYQFPYMEQRTGRPDPQPLLLETVRAAAVAAAATSPGVPLLAGGKSMGGRMTSLAASEAPLDGVRGLVFFGFPLHPTGRPSTLRAEHLARVGIPMLFLQGTRDPLADLTRFRPVCAALGSPATLHVVDGADHSFGMLKRSGRTQAEVLEEMVALTTRWAGAQAAPEADGHEAGDA